MTVKKHELIIHIAMADSQCIVRQAICKLISSFSGYVIDIEAGSGEELVAQLLAAGTLPDICVLDIALSGRNGYEILKEIKERWPGMKTLALTAIDNELAIELMLRCGAKGYLPKNSTTADLEKALTALYKTGRYYSDLVIQNMHTNMPKLTDSELRFLSFCYKDLTYKKIAVMMCVSTAAINKYHYSLAGKLKIKTRAGFAAFAISIGL